MYKIGIDVGSTFTKYCILNEKKEIEKTYPDSFTSLIEYLKDVA